MDVLGADGMVGFGEETRGGLAAPAIGTPTYPGRRSPSCRVDNVISVSVMPYRSTGTWPVSSRSCANTGTGSAARPRTAPF